MANSRAWYVGNVLRGITGNWSVSGTLTAGALSGPFNGTVGATTPSTGAFTTLSASVATAFALATNFVDNTVSVQVGPATNGNKNIITFKDSSGTTASIYGYNSAYGSGLNNTVATNIGGTNITAVSSTGLAVTGAISATDGLSVNSTATFSSAAGTTYGYIDGSNGLSALKISTNTGAQSLQLAIAGTVQATLDTSGNLGLGVVPSAWGSPDKPTIDIGAYGALYSATGVFGVGVAANTYYNGTNWIYKTTQAASTYYQGAGQHVWSIAPSGTAGNPITFTQAMTLAASGNLLLNTSAYAVSNTNSVLIGSSAGGAIWQHASGTSSGTVYHQFNYNAGSIGSITQSGTTAVLYNTTSDQRLKENIADSESANPLIDAIQVRQYDWKSDGSHQRYGFVAQELVEVYPEAVHQPADPEAMMAVDYSKLVPLLVKEVQQLRARLTAAGIA